MQRAFGIEGLAFLATLSLVAARVDAQAPTQPQASAPPRANAQARGVPLTTPAIQRFVSWLETHPETSHVLIWTDDGTMTALVADASGSLLCAGARNSAPACVRDPRAFSRLWRTGIREGADGRISGVTVAAGPVPGDEARGVVVDFALPAATVRQRNSVGIVAGAPPSMPMWMGQPFEDTHPAASVSSLRRGSPDLTPTEGPPWMSDSARLEVIRLNADIPALRVAERFSRHQAVCLKLESGWRCARRDSSLPETEGEESLLRVVDLHAVAPNNAPWWGIEYEWHHTAMTEGAHGEGGSFVEVIEFSALPHLIAKFNTGEIRWTNATTTVAGRRRFERAATRSYRPWHGVGTACIELSAATPQEIALDIDFRDPEQAARATARRPRPAAAAPAPDAAAPPPAPGTRLRFNGSDAFVPGDC